MRIKEITDQNRRDYRAIYVCEHCNYECECDGGGYDDKFFHQTVLPDKKCNECGKTSDKDCPVLTPRYSEHDVV